MVFGSELDWSFADKEPLRLGDVAVRDFTGDGIPDISMGVVGCYFLDWMGYLGGFTTTGEAPKSKILGLVDLWNGFFEAEWLFAAGFDIVEDGTVYYTGKVRAPDSE